MRYKVEPSAERPGWWVATDTESLIVVRWENKKFNETQRVSLLDACPTSASAIARALREIGDFLAINHTEKIM